LLAYLCGLLFLAADIFSIFTSRDPVWCSTHSNRVVSSRPYNDLAFLTHMLLSATQNFVRFTLAIVLRRVSAAGNFRLPFVLLCHPSPCSPRYRISLNTWFCFFFCDIVPYRLVSFRYLYFAVIVFVFASHSFLIRRFWLLSFRFCR
jgi:hypothetical protein